VSRSRSNACNPLAPRIDKNLGNPVVKRCKSVRLRIVGGYVFYLSTVAATDEPAGVVAAQARVWGSGEP
jgi:hypothetical protein